MKYLKEAFDKLNDEEKKQNYNLKINFDFQENWFTLTDKINNNIKEKFLSQVKNLFETFIQENKLSPNQLIVNEETKLNSQLCIESAPQHNDFEETFQINIKDYHYFIFEQMILNNINENISLKFDFKEIKEYLNKLKNNKFDTTDVPVITGKESFVSNEEIKKIKGDEKKEEAKKLNQYDVSYNALNEQGIFEGTMRTFMNFYKE
ncbi:hypothetical protein ['Camptotheca acuminata' phytoplasma]|uniref:hypothetical protein n=1 Tax='Camptotheca acuminata' phytoplasma TaxID=3239192 RepID=UPI00351A30CD